MILLVLICLALIIYLLLRFVDIEKLHFFLFVSVLISGLLFIIFVGILELFNPELAHKILNLVVQ